MHRCQLPARIVTSLPLACLLAFTAGCCCCMSGSNFSGSSWTPTPSPHIVNVQDANFTSVVLQAEKPTLVDFWAPWCGPCRDIDPAVVAIADEFQDRIDVARLNTTENPTTAGEYEIWAIPTLALFVDGQLVARQQGAPPGETIEDGLRKWLEGRLAKLSPQGDAN